jgi:hypothetical protein
MIFEKGPWLAGQVALGRLRYLEVLLELLTLPLAFHAMLLMAAVALAGSGFAVTGILALILHVAAAIQAGPSLQTDMRTLLGVPAYLLWKVRHLPGILKASARSTAWVRTARSNEGAANA